jgi:hypothetical protein
VYSVHMTTDTLPRSLPETREAESLPWIIAATFWFCLVLSVAGNVAATWGHVQDAIIGGLFPVLLVLAERVLHAAGRAPWWVRILIGAVAVACMIWSANHLAGLAHGWMRWLIPIAVDALLLLTGLLIVSHSSRREPPVLSGREVAERVGEALDMAISPDAGRYGSLPVGEPLREAPVVPSVREIQEAVDAGTARWEEAPESLFIPMAVERALSMEETVTETRTTTRRVSSSGDLSELASRLRAGVEAGETKPTISAAKTYLSIGHAKAKSVIEVLSSESENA